MSRWFVGQSGSPGVLYYRQQLPLRHLGADLADAGIEINFSEQLIEAFDADVCVFSRCIGADNLSAIQMLKQAGKIIVWDSDDDLTILDRFVEGAQRSHAKKEVAAFHCCLNLADVITVSVPNLAKALKREHKTVVLPNMIDLDDNPITEDHGGRDVILYCGTSSHGLDIELFRDLYDTTYKQYPWVFVGILPEWMDESSTYIPLPPVQSYHKVCRLIRPLFALAPLTVEPFNLSKSPIKVWETATLGASVLASNYGPYEGTCAGIVDPGENFTTDDLAVALYRRPSCIKEAIDNSWQASRSGREKWMNTFLSIEAMVNG